MLLFAHAGIPVGVAWLLRESLVRARPVAARLKARSCAAANSVDCPTDNRFAWLDYRPLMLGSLLPDIIDKPLGTWLLQDTLSNGRVFGHTLLFTLLLVAAGTYLYSRHKRRSVLFLSFGCSAHLCLDEMWLNPTTLLWPLYRWSFDKIDLAHWLERVLVSLGTEPSVYIPETIGGLLLVAFLTSLVRRHMLLRFLTKGDAA